MAYQYTTINGQRVEKNVAAAFERMRAAFMAKFKLDLLVSSGTRTRAEQQRLRDLYLAGKGNLAAPPGYSNHEESGPRGPRALDLRDSGSDAGVTRSGTTRAKWLRANAPSFGFNPAGYGFSKVEPWHYEYTGALAAGGAATASGHVTVNRSVKDVQRVVGAGQDGIWGPETDSKVRAFQKAHGLTADGIWGPRSDAAGFPPASSGDALIRAVQAKLKSNYPLYAGKLVVDGINGPATKAAVKEFQQRSGLTVDGIVGPRTRKALGV
ncbi:MAG: hypothetical protein BGN97_00195 [Microbacterium sp. 69-10]|uniref:peptidoglycan-binding protein n=1 Tax=Microbacterium sp. 69-10 TaxID=1895783 RepID=UPI00095F0E5F|nr:peptidoglycan-binding protein [Microbacterium sp. 69-10]OJU39675.1 MAG: hypothetical protein BGN97_00195 [Microbacterium sp. 69-10]